MTSIGHSILRFVMCIAAIVAVMESERAAAAQMTCYDTISKSQTAALEVDELGNVPADKIIGFGGKCLTISIDGEIATRDSLKFKNFLESMAGVTRIELNSPGGDLYEGMKLGHIFRDRLLSVSITGTPMKKSCSPNDKHCCASACALAYLGGAEWSLFDEIAMHRPTTKGMADLSLSETQASLKAAYAAMNSYFKDMQIDERFAKAAMDASPNSIQLVAIDDAALQKIIATEDEYAGDYYDYPPSIGDWLRAKCKHKSQRLPGEMRECMHKALDEERSKLPHLGAQPKAEKVQQLSAADLRFALKLASTTPPHKLRGIEKVHELQYQLEIAVLAEGREKIDAMDVRSLKNYIQSSSLSSAIDGEKLLVQRAYNRVEELTGERLIGDDYLDCFNAVDRENKLRACAAYVNGAPTSSKQQVFNAQMQIGELQQFGTKKQNAISAFSAAIALDPAAAYAYKSRARTLALMGENARAIDDYSKAIETASDKNDLTGLYLAKAELLEKTGEIQAAIDVISVGSHVVQEMKNEYYKKIYEKKQAQLRAKLSPSGAAIEKPGK